MTAWRKTLLSGALICAAGASLLILWRSHNQPRFQGKTAAEWFQEFRAADAMQRVQVIQVSPGVMRLVRSSRPEAPEARATAAADGLRGLGTNALPYLVTQLRRGETWGERFYPRVYFKMPPGIRKLLPNPPTPRDEVRRQAALAIAALGSKGTPAAKDLLEALKSCGPVSEFNILRALNRLDFDRERADEVILFLTQHGRQTRAIHAASELWLVSQVTAHCLLQALSQTNASLDRGYRTLCVQHLAYFGKHAPIVVPGLALVLQDSDLELRRTAANVLEEFGPAAAPALPALEQALQSDDSELRYLAARAVEAMGTNALPALPVLMQMTNDSFVPAQTVSKRVIEKLGRR